MKQLIAEDVIKATLAMSLYNEHGNKAVELVNEAIAAQELEQAQETTELELALKNISAGLDSPQAQAPQSPAPVAEDGAAAESGASKAPIEEPRKNIKITGKHISKLAGAAPKISKKTVEFVHKGFATLGQSIDQISLQGDHFVMKLTADEVELLKEIKAQLAAATKPEPDAKDPAQVELLEQAEAESKTGVTLQ